MYRVDIRKHDALTAAAVDHTGSYMTISRAFETLDQWLTARDLHSATKRMLALYLDDPTVVPEDALHSKACVEVPRPEAIPFDNTVSRVDIHGGEFAVLTHVGPYEQLRDAYQFLYSDWLPRSRREPANAPVHEVYLNTPRDVTPAELITEIWLPLRAATG